MPRPPDIRNEQSTYEVIYLEGQNAGGRGTEATVLLNLITTPKTKKRRGYLKSRTGSPCPGLQQPASTGPNNMIIDLIIYLSIFALRAFGLKH